MPGDPQRFLASLRLDGKEWHRVRAVFLAKQKRAASLFSGLGAFEYVIDRCHHAVAGAEVGAERMQAAGGGLTCAQVGIDVGTAKGIDRLLGVADQEQAGVRVIVFDAVNALEDAVLNRVGILEFVDQRDRELLADQRRQTLAAFRLQGGIQTLQHVVETHFRATTLLFFKTRAHPLGSVLQHRGIGRRQGIEARLEPGHGVQPRMTRRLTFPGLGHAIRCQSSEAGANVQLLKRLVFGPGLELLEPRLEITRLHLAAIDGFAGDALMAESKQLVCPGTPRHFQFDQRRSPLQQTFGDQLRRHLAFIGITRAGEQAADPRQQRCGATPITAHPVQRVTLHRVAKQSPVIAQHFAKQIAVIGFQRLREQAAAVERVLTQHALTPAVNGRDGSFVHPLRGDIEAVGAARPLQWIELIAQFGDQSVRSGNLVAEKTRSLGQAGSNTLTQLFGGSVGECHYEDLRRQQFACETACFAAMAENQPQIKRRDGEGFAGAGARFDQLTAAQREGQSQRCPGTHERAPSLDKERQGASNNGRYNASHQPVKVSSANNAPKSGYCRSSAGLSRRSPSLVCPSPS